ncbi:MAG: 3-phosphoserine/phosphohydroxythreonine transaminase [Gammaproteobacteria bacterium]|nr:3-phosphoserine/phosphohydroxythreonine transaminase [Gammaproteobacteria bacterium]
MISGRGINFNAGPAALPEEILLQAKDDILNWQGLGCGILEVGHRSNAFMSLLEETSALLKSILQIPAGFEVLWLGMPARMHFSAIPLNFLHKQDMAAYIVSGLWSDMALLEAKRMSPEASYCFASTKEAGFKNAPSYHDQLKDHTKYLYYTPNETVHGVSCQPPATSVPLVADMTSCILSEAIDFKPYACIFAGAQKNIANAGLSIAIIRQDFLNEAPASILPLTLDYRTHLAQHSLYVTPPTFNIYIANLMLKWLEKAGGISHFSALTQAKAHCLYDAIDASTMFQACVEKDARSPINVCFTSGADTTDAAFLEFAESRGLMGLKGHRALGGLRASLYNAVTMSAVESLVSCLQEFEKLS